MRYYKIAIDGGPTFTSLVDGRTDPGALNVEMDIVVAPYATPVGGSWARVWGIPLQQISQASDLNGKSIAIYGGMQKGLPLANPRQSGLLAKGTIFPAYGNWIGTDMSLDLMLAPPFGAPTSVKVTDQVAPANIVHNWPKGSSLADAVKSALQTAFPKFSVEVNVSANLKLPQNDVGYYQTMAQYAAYLQAVSRRILGSQTYPGVQIALAGSVIRVYDGTASSAAQPRKIEFQDMIGQPTWRDFNTLQVKTVMRADVAIGDQLTLPQGIAVATTSGSAPQFRSRSAFQGTFLVVAMRHVGNFRQPDAASWNTTIDLAALNTAEG
jgi:hypothetical protein